MHINLNVWANSLTSAQFSYWPVTLSVHVWKVISHTASGSNKWWATDLLGSLSKVNHSKVCEAIHTLCGQHIHYIVNVYGTQVLLSVHPHHRPIYILLFFCNKSVLQTIQNTFQKLKKLPSMTFRCKTCVRPVWDLLTFIINHTTSDCGFGFVKSDEALMFTLCLLSATVYIGLSVMTWKNLLLKPGQRSLHNVFALSWFAFCLHYICVHTSVVIALDLHTICITF